MKPQCTTAAQCLKELARVMDQFGLASILSAVNSEYVKDTYPNSWREMPEFSSPQEWQFAIAEVEGKPVFIGDELYSTNTGRKFQVHSTRESRKEILLLECYDQGHNEFCVKQCSWNPPKPKTVMVEMRTEVAEYAAENWIRDNKWLGDNAIAVGESCKLALEKLK